MIVAFSRNFGIGYMNKIPWKLKGDMKYFKKMTTGRGNNAVIMGKNTYNSLPLNKINNRFLPKRSNIILSKNNGAGNAAIISGNGPMAVFLMDKSSVYDWCDTRKFDEIWIIGGESIYTQYIRHIDLKEIHVTEVEGEYEIDTYFPPIPDNFFVSMRSKRYEENGIGYCYKVYKRICEKNINKSYTSFPKYSGDYI